jgi:hypothetical protein
MMKIHLGKNQRNDAQNRSDLGLIDQLSRVPPHLLQGFTIDQLNTIEQIIEASLPKPSPKLIDLRVDLNLLISRFYVVILVGKDRRSQKRHYLTTRLVKIGNLIAAIGILTGVNLIISFVIFMALYCLKSWLGINIFKEMHLIDVANYLLG